MKRTRSYLLLGIILILASACARARWPDEPGATSVADAAGPARVGSGTGSFFAINEVGLGPDGYVGLTNFTDVPASLDDLHLCQGSQCFALPDATVGPGETARVTVGDGAELAGVVATNATLGALRPSGGEIALLTSQDVDEPQAMLLYFQWGSTPHELTQTAIDAGLWVEGGYGPTSQNATRLYKVEESGLWLFDEP